jgi:hypothetical protein
MGLYAQRQEKGVAPKGKITKYETFVYTSDKVEKLVRDECKKRDETRGLGSDLLGATLNAGKGIAGGYVTSFIDLGVTAIASLATKSANDKLRWEEVVKTENTYQEVIGTVENINNFYSKPSFDGPMDPLGMNFNGIGCLRTVGRDTVFYISCHIDPSKISRIVNHSKFELSLDTLIINPYYCNLPNSAFDTVFSFDRRQNLQMTVEMKIISSWINEWTQLQKNQELGAFVISVPVNANELNAKGELRYVRTAGKNGKYKITGESFIIPRSYMGFRDEDNTYKNSWGTGEYRIEVSLKENCNITEAYRRAWKNDWKQRQEAQKKGNFAQRTWKVVSSQRWDEISRQWVVTTLKAPAGVVTDDLLEELNLNTTGKPK